MGWSRGRALNITATVVAPQDPLPGDNNKALLLVLQQNGQNFLSVFLDHVSQATTDEKQVYRFFFPTSLKPESCFFEELDAMLGSYVVFTNPKGQRATGVRAFYYAGITLKRSTGAGVKTSVEAAPFMNVAVHTSLMRKLSLSLQ